MKRIATFYDKDGKTIGLVHGPDSCNQEILVGKRIWRFDFDEYCGPLWLLRDGYTARKCQNPNKKVWKIWESWFRKYRKINKKHEI